MSGPWTCHLRCCRCRVWKLCCVAKMNESLTVLESFFRWTKWHKWPETQIFHSDLGLISIIKLSSFLYHAHTHTHTFSLRNTQYQTLTLRSLTNTFCSSSSYISLSVSLTPTQTCTDYFLLRRYIVSGFLCILWRKISTIVFKYVIYIVFGVLTEIFVYQWGFVVLLLLSVNGEKCDCISARDYHRYLGLRSFDLG